MKFLCLKMWTIHHGPGTEILDLVKYAQHQQTDVIFMCSFQLVHYAW
jgi:hypothetical protein